MDRTLPSTPDKSPPRLGGRYLVCRRLGTGGCSSVYLVWDTSLRTWRAAKVMHASQAPQREYRERFQREGITLANLDHPHIVRVHDASYDAAIPYLVMELVDGGSTAQWVKAHGPMPLGAAVRITRELTEALTAVHAEGMVHRDVKPQNVLLDRDGVSKLTDFGIARLPREGVQAEGFTAETQVGTVMGTASFMAPEQRVDASSVDARADVYGVGASLLALVRGRPSADAALLVPGDPALADLPQGLVAIVLRACAYRPGDRYPTATALARDLDAFRRTLPQPERDGVLDVVTSTLPGAPPATLDDAVLAELTELRSASDPPPTAPDRTDEREVSSLAGQAAAPPKRPARRPKGDPGVLAPPVATEDDLGADGVLALFLRNVRFTLMMAVMPAALALGLGAVGWVGVAVPGIRSASSATLDAEAEYHAQLRGTDGAVRELVAWGAPAGLLESLYFQFVDAKTPEARREHGEKLLRALGEQARATGQAEKVGPVLSRAAEARSRTIASYREWVARTDAGRGRTAVLLRLADAPPPGLAIYARAP